MDGITVIEENPQAPELSFDAAKEYVIAELVDGLHDRMKHTERINGNQGFYEGVDLSLSLLRGYPTTVEAEFERAGLIS